jgi:hypothetical protein
LSRLHGVTAKEATDTVTLTVLVAPRRPRSVRAVAQAFPKEGVTRIRLEGPLGERELIHGAVDPRHADDAEFLPIVRERKEGYGP